MSTTDSVDYYHVWLGIPPDEQPPTHYRLLGIRFFESNRTVISNAADRQMAHIKSYQNGPHHAATQKLLNELSAARTCLLNDQRRREYDWDIRCKMLPPEAPPIEAKPVPFASRVPMVTTDELPTMQAQFNRDAVWQPPELSAGSRTRNRKVRRDPNFVWRVIVIGLIAILVLAMAAYLYRRTWPLSLADVHRMVNPSVVHIETDQQTFGSGVIIGTDGFILTNYHVVAGASLVTIKFASGAQHIVKGYLAADPGRDLVVIRITLRPPRRGIKVAPNIPSPGDGVAAFGSPGGLPFSISGGDVSAIRTGHEVRQQIGPEAFDRFGFDEGTTWIQHTAALAPGSSGGPLVNMQGELVGLNTWSRSGGQNVNFAIGAPDIRRLLKEAKDTNANVSESLLNLPNPRRDNDQQKSKPIKRPVNAEPPNQSVEPAPVKPEAESNRPVERKPLKLEPERNQPVKPEPKPIQRLISEPFPSGHEYSPGMFDVDTSALDPKDKNLITLKHPNGQVFALASHIKGRLHGLSIARHDNGKPMVFAKYFEGKRDGLLVTWDKDGAPVMFSQYRTGRRIGITCFFDSGNLRLLLDYEFNKLKCIRLILGQQIEEEFSSEADAEKDAEAAELLAKYKAVDADLFENELEFKRQVKKVYEAWQKVVSAQNAVVARERILQSIAREQAENEAARRQFMNQMNEVLKPQGPITLPVIVK